MARSSCAVARGRRSLAGCSPAQPICAARLRSVRRAGGQSDMLAARAGRAVGARRLQSLAAV
eukprot:1731569-Alexandrium_andersonii.AAC.1